MDKTVLFVDTEVSVDNKKILDIGAIKEDSYFHSSDIAKFRKFAESSDYLCGHNIIEHDLKYLSKYNIKITDKIIDTLYLSALLFPKHPYHNLVKDDKIISDELNNPLNDCKKAIVLFEDEVSAFNNLEDNIKKILYLLLKDDIHFKYFFYYVNYQVDGNVEKIIKEVYKDKICDNCDLNSIINDNKVALAYVLSMIYVDDNRSIMPRWVICNYPVVDNIIQMLRSNGCGECSYCLNKLDVKKGLKEIFGYDSFRTYNGEPLQEMAARAAVENKSLLAVFPTGGGKSITFQLPALMSGEATRGLTVVISPLQSLMKDQVDNLNNIGITEAVTINGLLDPIQRAQALEQIRNGEATILYISPEQLRSKTVERLLSQRYINRFVIDEAHCFSAWGQDFRVDYLYIGDFIREIQDKKKGNNIIPVSCFTATAKQKVITDICDYFKNKLDLDLELFASNATRENLHYTVLFKETEEDKYIALRSLIQAKNCPTIVYVSRTKRTKDIAERLTRDGIIAKPFNGKMEANDKVLNQEAFINNQIQVIVATSAFGMGVDKKDVKLVVHYDISSSLEDYVQEAGRAGRDPSINAECYVLYNDNDLDKHFLLLNQSKLSISEIQQVWKAIKNLTKTRLEFNLSCLEIAREAGWDDSVLDIETRVKTAVSALECAGFIRRGMNTPNIFATSILVSSMMEASDIIDASELFDEKEKLNAKRIIKSLISNKSLVRVNEDIAESRVDYIADMLGLTKETVIGSVNMMRQVGILADTQDMKAYIKASDNQNKAYKIFEDFTKLERFIIDCIGSEGADINLKELNELAQKNNIKISSIKNIKTIIYYYKIKNIITKKEYRKADIIRVVPNVTYDTIMNKYLLRVSIAEFIIEELYQKAKSFKANIKEEKPVLFSLVGLLEQYNNTPHMNMFSEKITLKDVEDALLYLSKIGAIKIDGGFMVLYNAMNIKRLIQDNKLRYKVDDYKYLNDFYQQKIRQIHIVGEYANLMVKNYDAALQYVQDYFQMDFKKFIKKYFQGERSKEIDLNITPAKYRKLFESLSKVQKDIIDDNSSNCIVVAAGPGSGKTRVLVHKLASLLLLEDIKHEQLLMLTFSRAAAIEFKMRLKELVGNGANYVDIKTFHSYCFDLLGKIGKLENANDVIKEAVELIENNEVEISKITKGVLVIDEAQDMDENEYRLVSALMKRNEEMRVIAVGDDNQNIYGFRGSDSKYLRMLISDHDAKKYEMMDNYRSKKCIVDLCNEFVKGIEGSIKTQPIVAVSDDKGLVNITKYRSEYMGVALVDNVIETNDNKKCCILTNTNEEALQLVHMLKLKGVHANLLQDLQGFNLYNLMEIRYFLKCIDKQLNSPYIDKSIWENAKYKFYNKFKNSNCLDVCKNIIKSFEITNNIYYRNDLDEYFKEIKYEDFYDDSKNCIYVSTIHKSKGREFEKVYMLLNNITINTDEDRRKLYVGMSRAKEELYIHTNSSIFDKYKSDDIQLNYDFKTYEKPLEFASQLGYKDVVLDFFKNKKELIFKLYSGCPLRYEDNYMLANIDNRDVRVLKLSKKFVEKLNLYLDKGYIIDKCYVRFIVAWKNEDDMDEVAVILPDIIMKKKQDKLLCM